MVKHKAEEGRVAVRNLRRSARHELQGLERDGDISSDERRACREGAGQADPGEGGCARGGPRSQRAGAARAMNLRQAQKSMALTWSGTLFTRGGR